jgi:hypothetical protein
MSIALVFLDIKKPFDTVWHLGFLHKLSKCEFLTSLIICTRYSFNEITATAREDSKHEGKIYEERSD